MEPVTEHAVYERCGQRVRILRAHDADRATPSLFDLLDMEQAA